MQKINLSRSNKQLKEETQEGEEKKDMSHFHKYSQDKKYRREEAFPRIVDLKVSSESKQPRHRRYKTDLQKEIPKKISIRNVSKDDTFYLKVNSKSFDDYLIKESGINMSYKLPTLKQPNKKSKFNHFKKFSLPQPPEKMQTPLRKSSNQKQPEDNIFQISLIQPETSQKQLSKHDISFKPSLWRVHQFDKILQDRLRSVIKKKSNAHHKSIQYYE